MFYKHIISLLFLTITANSFKLDEIKGNGFEHLSKSEDDEDSILQDKDEWKEFSSEISEELDENLEEFLEEKRLAEGIDDNEVMKMANYVDKMAQKDTIIVHNGGNFGTWGDSEYCRDGAYAVGYDLKIQPSQKGDDDTALNGIKLYCEFPGGREANLIMSTEGNLGEWHGQKHCKMGDFLTRFQLQVEKDQGGWFWQDDTSANFVLFKCRDLDGNREYQLDMPPGKGKWGTYGSWSRSCPDGQAICGLTTKVENCDRCDNTALNDVKFHCCN